MSLYEVLEERWKYGDAQLTVEGDILVEERQPCSFCAC